VVETIADVISFILSIVEFGREPSVLNGAAIVGDGVSIFVPFLPAAGRAGKTAVKFVTKADNVPAGTADDVVDAATPPKTPDADAPADTTPPGDPDPAPPSECFVAGTAVRLADGSTKPIEEIETGDVVLSRCDITGETAPRRVKRTFEREHDGSLVLRFAGGEVIHTTPEHPFYLAGTGWVQAGRLAIGTSVVTRAGPALELVGIEHRPGKITVYNFEVTEFHTYFVGQTDGGVWVHNTCPPGGTGPTGPGFTSPLDEHQQVLADLVQEASLQGRRPLSVLDAEAVLDWAREYRFPGARAEFDDVTYPSNWDAMGGIPHIHLTGVGRNGHVPVAIGVVPRSPVW
jgi:hypothetical protein